jgi:hypothetical protein
MRKPSCLISPRSRRAVLSAIRALPLVASKAAAGRARHWQRAKHESSPNWKTGKDRDDLAKLLNRSLWAEGAHRFEIRVVFIVGAQ